MVKRPTHDVMPVTAESVERARVAMRDELREAASASAFSKGHVLGTWYELTDDGVEVAYCRPCRRRVVIDITRDPHLSGDALREACQRPDAFLANQHESEVR